MSKSSREYFKEYNATHREKRRVESREYRRKNRDKILVKQRERSRLSLTGFTQADWDERFVEQAGICRICGVRAAACADHNHQTGQKRALLCQQCNRALGFIEHDMYPKYLAYLAEWNARG